MTNEKKIRNSNLEIRNNFEVQMTKIPNWGSRTHCFENLNFELRVCFGVGYSDLEFLR